MKFHEKLRNLRQEKKISQKELAEMIGVSQTAIYQWEKGTRLPKTEQIYKIAAALQVEVPDLVGEDFSDRILKTLKSIETIPDQIAVNLKKANLLNYYEKLNETGQTEAVKRVNELTYIPEYQKKENDQPPK